MEESVDEWLAWRSFVFWLRAVVDVEKQLPKEQEEAVRQRCPDFLESRRKPDDYETIWQDLSAWIENRFFSSAVRDGWIEALQYYAGKHARSECIWHQWSNSVAEWRARRPENYPTPDEWDAMGSTGLSCASVLCASSGAEFRALVNRYIEGEAFTLWARAILESEHKMTAELRTALEHRYPVTVDDYLCPTPSGRLRATDLWKKLVALMERCEFSDSEPASTLIMVRQAARSHLRAERIMAYWAECNTRWTQARPASYPSFEQWLHSADAFVAD